MSSRLRSRLIWSGRDVSAGDIASGPGPVAAAALTQTKHVQAPETVELDLPAAPRDQAIALLHVGSEVEHALMAQYLYAAYSLNSDQDSEEKRGLVKQWRSVILEIAREEMGHLATVQNVLTLIGGPLCFEREDYPIIDPELFPFPFQLEKLTKFSLGKYVLAEMPSAEAIRKLELEEEIEEIKQRVHVQGKLNIHRVGLIYDAITRMFTFGPMVEGPQEPGETKPHSYVATVDIQASSLPFQVAPGAWGLGNKEILIETAHDRNSALHAIKTVSLQGEGDRKSVV